MKFEGLASDLSVRKIFEIFAGTMGCRALSEPSCRTPHVVCTVKKQQKTRPAPIGTGPGLMQIIVVIPITKGQTKLASTQRRLGPLILLEPPEEQLSIVLEVDLLLGNWFYIRDVGRRGHGNI